MPRWLTNLRLTGCCVFRRNRVDKALALLSYLLWWSTAVTGQALTNLRELGQREYQAGHYAESESYFRAALEGARLDDDSRAGILSDLGTLLLDEERLSEAEEAYTKALAIEKRRVNKQAIASLSRDLGVVYSMQRRDEEAISLLNQALKLAKTPPVSPQSTASVLNSLGVAHFRQARLKKAGQFFNQGLQTLANAESTFEVYAPLLNNLGTVYGKQRNFRLAEELLTRALSLTSAQFGPAHPVIADSLDGLGVVYTEMGRYADAEAQYRRAIAILEQQGPIQFDVRIARAQRGLADTYLREGKKSDAAIALEQAVRLARPKLTTSPDMILILEACSRLLVALGRPSEAKDLGSEAHRARVAIASTVRAYKPD